MNVRKIVIALKTKLVYQNTVLTPALEQPVVKVQYVMPLATEPNALVHVDFKEIHMFLAFLLDVEETLIVRIGSNVMWTPKNAKSSAGGIGVPKVQNVLPETTRRHVHAFHHLREMDMPFAPHPLKLTLSLNVALTMIVHQKWPAFRKVARTHVCQPIHASKGSNVMSYLHHLVDP